MTKVTARASKARAKQDERDVARLLGGERHPADMGGPEDVSHPTLAIQVKGRASVPDYLREGMAAAQAAAAGTIKLPVLVLVDRSGTRVQRYAIIPLEEFASEMKTREKPCMHENWERVAIFVGLDESTKVQLRCKGCGSVREFRMGPG
jgi:hypothetical protein